MAICEEIRMLTDVFIQSIFMKFIMTCAAGLESILKKEIEIAGYKVTGS